MELQAFQPWERRDSNDNIIRPGSYGKKSALANAQNTGILDYIGNNLDILNNQVNLLLSSSSEYTDISSINTTLTNFSNQIGSMQADVNTLKGSVVLATIEEVISITNADIPDNETTEETNNE